MIKYQHVILIMLVGKIKLSLLSQVSWGKKVLLVGGKTDPASDKVSGLYSPMPGL